jgi:hypothetical protein
VDRLVFANISFSSDAKVVKLRLFLQRPRRIGAHARGGIRTASSLKSVA